jgi:hypothetical protein
MIFIPRPPGSRPEVLSDADGLVTREIAGARAYLTKVGRKKGGGRKRKSTRKAGGEADVEATGFKFQLYRKPAVKDALENLFHRKCAYCENRYRAAHPVDVEHWRPKAGVKIEETPGQVREPHPGYYWLAAVWENLLPSCINCNRASKQEQLPTGERIVAGKGSLFPLSREDRRAYSSEEITNEDPLLLDPTVDRPEAHLEFVDECVLRARTDSHTGRPSERGMSSINVFGLNRTDLVMERQEVMADIVLAQTELQKLLKLYELQSSDTGRAGIEDLIRSKMEFLVSQTSDARRFALLARSMILPFLNSISPHIPATADRELIERATRMGAATANAPTS